MSAYERFNERISSINDLMNTMSILNWDARVVMPPGGSGTRGEQLATLAQLTQERFTSEETGGLIEAAAGEVSSLPDDDYRVRAVANAKEAYSILKRVPTTLTRELTTLKSVAQPVWAEAKAKKDYASFAPYLEKIVTLTRDLSGAIGYEAHPYDAMLKQYESGMTAAQLEVLFNDLRAHVLPLLEGIRSSSVKAPTHIFNKPFPRQQQRAFGLAIAQKFGFDIARGRLDESHHPFEISFTRNDVRMTTRYQEDYLPGAIFGIFHETGHALYEQNIHASLTRSALTTDFLGMYAVGGTSFGLHESQSRLWENTIGRSYTFWQNHYGTLQAYFPEQLAEVDLETFYRAVNDVKPSLIRVEADEITYNFHIMLRTEIEMGLLNGSMAVNDLPEIWNGKMQSYLGITPPDDSVGVLQDIHWAHGHIGTFPTYTLGNVMAAQFFAAARQQVEGLDASLEQADYTPLREWLTRNIYQHGRAYTPEELLKSSTGEGLNAEPYVTYLKEKFSSLYGL